MKISEMKFTTYDSEGTLESLWSVKPTGNYERDCKTGRNLATDYIAALRSGGTSPGSLLQIVKAMPLQTTGVEVGFLNAVAGAI